MDFYISQFLIGHGSFGVYTQRLGISENAFCVYCGGGGFPRAHGIVLSSVGPLQDSNLRRARFPANSRNACSAYD
ncbi:hypothetical protein NQ314_012488 [Rhamnusium bicolor]|uniref:Uncharacterized protein n=1 Tax=Rhamnusium bicolor TaxID=1586634 RepID=A0AAV8XDM5_9CUCU|nr:hypothetical protein NQ314_012488 [Rhamnusium bicolor]